MKTKYKGFIIESGSTIYEETYHDFNDGWQGKGTYNTSFWVEVTDPKTLKSCIFTSKEEAETFVDNLQLYKKQNKEKEKIQNELARQIKKLEEEKDILSKKQQDLRLKMNSIIFHPKLT